MDGKTKKALLASVSVALIASVALFYVDTTFLQTLAGIPLFAGLLAVLWVFVSDLLAHERKLRQQEAQNDFVVGATSHMANVAFDRFAEFAEHYAREAHAALDELFREGPSKAATGHAGELYRLRLRYFIWLTMEIDSKLFTLERALSRVGLLSRYDDPSYAGAANELKSKELDRIFAELVGEDLWSSTEDGSRDSVNKVMQWIREVLGTEELTSLRRKILANADQQLRQSAD